MSWWCVFSPLVVLVFFPPFFFFFSSSFFFFFFSSFFPPLNCIKTERPRLIESDALTVPFLIRAIRTNRLDLATTSTQRALAGPGAFPNPDFLEVGYSPRMPKSRCGNFDII